MAAKRAFHAIRILAAGISTDMAMLGITSLEQVGRGRLRRAGEHEWKIWNEFKLPDDKILIPGVVSHCVCQWERPELVADRTERFAGIVGRERVIAGMNCGFAPSRAGDEVHPDAAWAKLKTLAEGAGIASGRLRH